MFRYAFTAFSRPCSPLFSFTTRRATQTSIPNEILSSLRPRIFNIRFASGRARPPPRRYNQGPSFKSRLSFLDTVPTNTVFYTIVGINGAVFLAWKAAESRVHVEGNYDLFRFMSRNFLSNWQGTFSRPWTLLTSAFSHKDLNHLFLNGLGLFFLVRPVLDVMGSKAFLGMYLGGALCANITSLAWKLYGSRSNYNSHGASGAISASLAYLTLSAPRTTFLVYFVVPAPAWAVFGGFLAYDIYMALTGSPGTTDYAGHIGGALGGAAYFFLTRRVRFI